MNCSLIVDMFVTIVYYGACKTTLSKMIILRLVLIFFKKPIVKSIDVMYLNINDERKSLNKRYDRYRIQSILKFNKCVVFHRFTVSR